MRRYFSMLEGELRGRCASGRRFARPGGQHDRQSERGYRQVAAVPVQEGLLFHNTYRPLASYPEGLRAAVAVYLANHPELLRPMEADVDAPAGMVPEIRDRGLDDIACRSPEPGEIPEVGTDGTARPPLSGNDFLAQEQRNPPLARAGELFVLQYEIRWLRDAGADACANAVEHVSAEQGTGGGCDIHSDDADGGNRYIKVKTTRFRRETPFFVNANEIATAALHREQFWLYRVFDLGAEARVYSVNGPLKERSRVQPVVYRATPR